MAVAVALPTGSSFATDLGRSNVCRSLLVSVREELRREFLNARTSVRCWLGTRVALSDLQGREVDLVIRVHPRSSLPIPSRPPRSARYYNGWFSPEQNAAISEKVCEMSERGYELLGSRYRDGALRLIFSRRDALFDQWERLAEPSYLASQRAALQAAFQRGAAQEPFLSPSRHQTDFSSVIEQDAILTAETIGSVSDGLYSFVRLRGENFLRIGQGHHRLGAREIAAAAGDIEIHDHQVVFLSPRSDTYRPAERTLVWAVEALWRQGIFPSRLELRHWNNRDVIVSL